VVPVCMVAVSFLWGVCVCFGSLWFVEEGSVSVGCWVAGLFWLVFWVM